MPDFYDNIDDLMKLSQEGKKPQHERFNDIKDLGKELNQMDKNLEDPLGWYSFWGEVGKFFSDVGAVHDRRFNKDSLDIGTGEDNLWKPLGDELGKIDDVLQVVSNAYAEAHDASVRGGHPTGGHNVVVGKKREVVEYVVHHITTTVKAASNAITDYSSYFKDNFLGIMDFIATYEQKNGPGSFFKNHNITNKQAGAFTNFVSGYWNQTKLIAEHNKAQQCESCYSPSSTLMAISATAFGCFAVGGLISSLFTYYYAKMHYTPVSQNNDKA